MAKLTDKDIKHVAKLANLPIADSEIKKYKEELSEIIEYVSQLENVRTADVDMKIHTIEQVNVLREDKINQGDVLSTKEALSATEETHNNYFIVPAVINKNNS